MGPIGFRGIFRTDAEARAVYAESAGITRMLPRAVAVPEDLADVQRLIHWARAEQIGITARGSGTSMAGGAVGDGVVVDLSRMRQMASVDPDTRTIRAAPGVLRDDVDARARARGLRFPVDPSSGTFCTVGGMAATNAAGAHTLRYGAMRRWTVALDCVFDDGSSATIRRGEPPPEHVPAVARFLRDAVDPLGCIDRSELSLTGVRKNSSGYGVAEYLDGGDLVDLLVGSEGTLCLIVGVELALTAAPDATATVTGAFPDLESAAFAASRAAGAGAAACELLDRTYLELAARGYRARREEVPWPASTEALLLAEVEGIGATADPSELRRLFLDAGARDVLLARTRDDERRLWEMRHAASPTIATLGLSMQSMQLVEDGAVPPVRLVEYVRGVRGALASAGVSGVLFGHAGDAHVHVNPLIDTGDGEWRATARRLMADVVALTASLGGTLAGEHGDGRLRAPLLERIWSAEARRAFALVKAAFDPDGLFNPGVKLAAPGGDPLASNKYDASLPPLPPAARRALDVVTRERAYAESRLSLLSRAD